jgi:hypothetical protein
MLAALAAAGLIASSGAAGAATTSSGPINLPAPIWGATDSGQSTASVTYACDLLAAGQGVGAVNIDATLSVPAVASEGEAATIALTTHATALSALSSSLLSGLVSVGVAGAARVDSASGADVALAGHARVAAGDATQSPSVMAVGKLALATAGTTTVFVPPTITVTLSALTQVLVSLHCSTSSTAVKINVTAPASPTPGGPVYTCTNGTGKGSIDAPLPLAVSVTGPRVTGSEDTVTLSSPSDGLGAPYPSGTSALDFSGSLSVAGALQGSISLSRHTTVLTDKVFSVLGQLYLAEPGTYRILLPSRFAFTIFGTEETHLSCALKKSPAPTGLTLTVTGKPAGGHGSTAATGALPAGAPNTGGGSGSGGSLPLIAGGAALVLIGGGGFAFAARRRRLGQPSS